MGTNTGVGASIWGYFNQRMIMTRMQDHMVVTADGQYHALVNLGLAGGLVMMTSDDYGASWTTSFAIPDTTPELTADIQLLPDGETLLVSYVSAEDRVVYSAYQHDSGGGWSLTTTSVVEDSGIDPVSVHPTLTQGPRGWLLVSYMEETDQGMRLMLATSPDGGETWVPVETHIVDASQGSARIVATSEEVGLLYTTETSMNWASYTRGVGLTVEEVLSTATPGAYSSHFSTAVMGDDIYLATTDKSGHLIFTWYDGSSETWQEPVTLTGSQRHATSAQVSVSDEGYIYLTFDDLNHNVLIVAESTDGGASWHNTATLRSPASVLDAPMRFETPDYFTGDLVVLQQIVNPQNEDMHGLLAFHIDGSEEGIAARAPALETLAEPGLAHFAWA